MRACALAILLPACQTPLSEAQWHDISPHVEPALWQETQFGGEGGVEFETSSTLLGFGSPLTGLNWWADLPMPEHYQLEVVASRVDGTDFFCGLNFPIGDSEATAVLGGWGGALCGLSCIDGFDASMNQTRSFQDFRPGVAVTLRIEVDPQHVRAWLDEEPLFDVPRTGMDFALRTEVSPLGRLGVASFQTRSRIHSMRWRPLKE